MIVETLFTPAEFSLLQPPQLRTTTCVVFDILRATTSMVTALANGAKGIIPVKEIEEAIKLKAANPDYLLAGERHGRRISAEVQGKTIEFDFGNSPREFVGAKLEQKVLVTTTTNGTRALTSCLGAPRIFAGSFLNMRATVEAALNSNSETLLLVCAGTYEETAFEDILAAGCFAEMARRHSTELEFADSTHSAHLVYTASRSDLLGSLVKSKNARRLRSWPELADDVPFSLELDTQAFAAEMKEGMVRKFSV